MNVCLFTSALSLSALGLWVAPSVAEGCEIAASQGVMPAALQARTTDAGSDGDTSAVSTGALIIRATAVDVIRGTAGPFVGCVDGRAQHGVPNSCADLGVISIAMELTGSFAAEDLFYQVSVIDGALPEGSGVKTIGGIYTSSRGALVFLFDDGATTEQEAFAAILEIRAIDSEGNRGAPVTVLVADAGRDSNAEDHRCSAITEDAGAAVPNGAAVVLRDAAAGHPSEASEDSGRSDAADGESDQVADAAPSDAGPGEDASADASCAVRPLSSNKPSRRPPWMSLALVGLFLTRRRCR